MGLLNTNLLKSFFSFLLFAQLFIVQSFGQQSPGLSNNYQLIVGTYTNSGKSEGIYTYHFNSTTGVAELMGKINTAEPSFLTIEHTGRLVYAVNELGNNKGAISAFRYNKANGSLQLLNSVASGGDHPCYITTDSKSRYLFVANYTGGSFSATRIKDNGMPDTVSQFIQHTGKSITARQEKAHVHSTVLSPDEKYLLVQDLGMDQISVYAVNLSAMANPVAAKPVSVFNTIPGSGPRHLVFHPLKNIAYSVQELNGLVNVMRFDNGKLRLLQEITMLEIQEAVHPGSIKDKRTPGAADIHISPDGKFLYASNRGDFNEIVIYAIAANGRLTYTATQSTLGKAPRNFGIDPTGHFLLAGNHLSDEIVIFRRDLKTGRLTDTGNRIKVGAPVCIQFVAD